MVTVHQVQHLGESNGRTSGATDMPFTLPSQDPSPGQMVCWFFGQRRTERSYVLGPVNTQFNTGWP